MAAIQEIRLRFYAQKEVQETIHGALGTGYLKEFSDLYEELEEKKVGIFAVCAEDQDKADQAVKDWELKFPCFSDMTHVLRNYLDVQGLISIRVSGGENSDAKVYKVHPKIKLYKYGVAQPGVLCVKPDASLLYAWAIEPTLMNLGGASDRPVPRDIWTHVQMKLSNPDEAESAPPRIRTRGNCSICTVQ